MGPIGRIGRNLIQITEFVEVEEDEANVGETSGSSVNVTALKVGNVVFVGGSVFDKGVGFARLFGHDGSLDGGFVNSGFWGEFPFFNGGGFPFRKAGFQFGGRGIATEGDFKGFAKDVCILSAFFQKLGGKG